MRLCLLRWQAESILTTFPYLRKHFPQILINWPFFDCHYKCLSLNEIRSGAKNFSNSQGKPCSVNLRPGRYAYVQAPGGADFHLLSVYFDSGKTNRDYQYRRQAAARLGAVIIGES